MFGFHDNAEPMDDNHPQKSTDCPLKSHSMLGNSLLQFSGLRDNSPVYVTGNKPIFNIHIVDKILGTVTIDQPTILYHFMVLIFVSMIHA